MLFVQGYLKIRASGYSAERFLNLCKNKNIKIWGVKPTKQGYEMYITISDFRKLKPIMRKTKTKVMIEERIGLPFFFYKHRKRFLFFIGIFLCAFLVFIGTFFVWNIEITGNQSVTKEVVLEYLESKNVMHGMLKTNVECERIAKDIRREFDDVIWVSASLEGTKLSIHIKENMDNLKEKKEENIVCDIVSDKDGKIISIITRNGVPKVKEGSEVKKGDVLVSGVIEVLNDAKEVVENHGVKADADIIIETMETVEYMLQEEYKAKEYTTKKRVIPWIKIGNIIFEFKFLKHDFANYEVVTQETQLRIGENFFLPVFFGKQQIKEYKWQTKKYTDKEMENLLSTFWGNYLKKLEENNCIIVNYSVDTANGNGEKKLSAKMVLWQECGERRKIVDF